MNSIDQTARVWAPAAAAAPATTTDLEGVVGTLPGASTTAAAAAVDLGERAAGPLQTDPAPGWKLALRSGMPNQCLGCGRAVRALPHLECERAAGRRTKEWPGIRARVVALPVAERRTLTPAADAIGDRPHGHHRVVDLGALPPLRRHLLDRLLRRVPRRRRLVTAVADTGGGGTGTHPRQSVLVAAPLPHDVTLANVRMDGNQIGTAAVAAAVAAILKRRLLIRRRRHPPRQLLVSRGVLTVPRQLLRAAAPLL